jgi:ABC-type dipeptide/oligopeptide/nickel transport system ATPase component
MKIIEKDATVKIDVFKSLADKPLQYYHKKSNTHKPADWLNDSPFYSKNNVICLTGACGSGKTTMALSIVASMKERVYCGVFDKVFISIPESTFKSISSPNLFEELPPNQIYHTFDEELLDTVKKSVERDSMEDMDTLFLVDDAASSLKTNRRIEILLTDLVCKHRHLKLTIILLVQSIVQVPLAIRENLSCLFIFKPINEKRNRLIYDEYMTHISYQEFVELNETYLYKNKGDNLMIKMEIPRKYYRNLKEFEIEKSYKNKIDNNINGINSQTEEYGKNGKETVKVGTTKKEKGQKGQKKGETIEKGEIVEPKK